MRFMENGKERYQVMKQMAQIIQDEVPVIFETTPLVSGLVQSGCKTLSAILCWEMPFKFFNLKKETKRLGVFMPAYILKRLLYMIPVLFGVALLTFLLFSVFGEDPVLQALGNHATQESIEASTS